MRAVFLLRCARTTTFPKSLGVRLKHVLLICIFIIYFLSSYTDTALEIRGGIQQLPT